MIALQQTIYRLATDADFRQSVQAGAVEMLDKSLTAEERQALCTVSQYLVPVLLSPILVKELTDIPGPTGTWAP